MTRIIDRFHFRYKWENSKLYMRYDLKWTEYKEIEFHYFAKVIKELLLQSSGASFDRDLDSTVLVRIRPSFVRVHGYNRGVIDSEEDVYPKSSGGWYNRYVPEADTAVYVVHDIEVSDNKWLCIFDPENKEILEAHIIRPFESETLYAAHVIKL